MLLDKALEHTPAATTSWNCPWFRIVATLCAVVIVCGLLAGTMTGSVTAVLAGMIVGRILHERDHEVTSCSV